MIQHSIYPLVRKTAAGDREAFEQLLRSQNDLILWIINKMTDCPEDAEDIRQEVSIRIFLHIASLRYPEAFGPWLRAIVIHECIRHIEAQRQCQSVETLADWEDKIVDHDPDCNPFASMENHELCDAVRAALESMHEQMRQVFRMRYCEDMQYRDIADSADMKPGTVSATLFRAREKIREVLRLSGIDA